MKIQCHFHEAWLVQRCRGVMFENWTDLWLVWPFAATQPCWCSHQRNRRLTISETLCNPPWNFSFLRQDDDVLPKFKLIATIYFCIIFLNFFIGFDIIFPSKTFFEVTDSCGGKLYYPQSSGLCDISYPEGWS